jgi:hypothetical protein
MKTITESYIEGLGFKLVKQYDHDQYHTNRYKRGPLMVEFTYEGDKLESCDLCIEEVNGITVTRDQLAALADILSTLPRKDRTLRRFFSPFREWVKSIGIANARMAIESATAISKSRTIRLAFYGERYRKTTEYQLLELAEKWAIFKYELNRRLFRL